MSALHPLAAVNRTCSITIIGPGDIKHKAAVGNSLLHRKGFSDHESPFPISLTFHIDAAERIECGVHIDPFLNKGAEQNSLITQARGIYPRIDQLTAMMGRMMAIRNFFSFNRSQAGTKELKVVLYFGDPSLNPEQEKQRLELYLRDFHPPGTPIIEVLITAPDQSQQTLPRSTISRPTSSFPYRDCVCAQKQESKERAPTIDITPLAQVLLTLNNELDALPARSNFWAYLFGLVFILAMLALGALGGGALITGEAFLGISLTLAPYLIATAGVLGFIGFMILLRIDRNIPSLPLPPQPDRPQVAAAEDHKPPHADPSSRALELGGSPQPQPAPNSRSPGDGKGS